MAYLIYTLAALFAVPFVTWIFYLAIMTLKANKSELTPVAKVFAYGVLFVGYPIDIVMNVFVGSITFFEIPKEVLFTSRCTRHLNIQSGWRYKVAQWWCHNFLDPFDTNNRHCE